MKNCHTCEHLEYESGDYEAGNSSGFVCEKRDPQTEAGWTKLERDMQREPYRNRYKRCYEARADRPTAQGAAA